MKMINIRTPDKTQNTKHKTQNTKHKTQNTKHKTQNTKQYLEHSPDNASNKKERHFGGDVVRSLAIFLVIGIHVAAMDFNKFNANWTAVNIFLSAARESVPLFFMVSGALLLDIDEGISGLARRLLRIGLPTVIWAWIYIQWNHYFSQPSPITSLLDMYSTLPYFHFWFVYAIFGIYLGLPFLRGMTRGKISGIIFFLILWAMVVMVGPSARALGIDIPNTAINIGQISSYSGYVVVGWLISKWRFYDRRLIGSGFALYIAVVAFTAWRCYMWSLMHNAPSQEPYYSYIAPWTFIGSCGLFFSLWNLKAPNRLVAKVFLVVADNAFAIYFLHIIVLQSLSWGLFTGIQINSETTGSIWTGLPFLTVLIFGVCLVLVYPLRRIKHASYLLG
ncbi:TPA: acyltransferase [Yersinia enterocolitica]